jgi:hypothetical protein
VYLYAAGFTGIDDPYEPPCSCEVCIYSLCLSYVKEEDNSNGKSFLHYFFSYHIYTVNGASIIGWRGIG